ncbi:uncharacterized protein PG986_004127 [Apiospora aurea]|uniref:Uncharacterized protein n=1 Tax=Apiospora aurea TaxID=335848 RepID=A0ABR1QLX8_9PEZI
MVAEEREFLVVGNHQVDAQHSEHREVDVAEELPANRVFGPLEIDGGVLDEGRVDRAAWWVDLEEDTDEVGEKPVVHVAPEEVHACVEPDTVDADETLETVFATAIQAVFTECLRDHSHELGNSERLVRGSLEDRNKRHVESMG